MCPKDVATVDGAQRRVNYIRGCTLLRHIRKNLFDIILAQYKSLEINFKNTEINAKI